MHFSTAIENWNRRFWNGLTRFQTSEDRRRLEKWGEVKIIFRAAELVETFYKWRKSRFRLHPLWKKFFFIYNVRKLRFNMAWPKIFSFSLIANEKILKMMIEPGEIAWVGSHLQNFNREIIHYNQRLRKTTMRNHFSIELPYKAISAGATFEFRALSVTFQIDFSWCKQSTAHQEVASVMILIESRLAADFLDKISKRKLLFYVSAN